MSNIRPLPHQKLLRSSMTLLAAAALLFAACDTDSPTAPQQAPPPPGGSATATFSISVTANPNQLSAGEGSSVITISAVRSDNGQAPTNGTTMTVSTTLGSFGSAGSGQQSGFVELQNGTAQVAFFPDSETGTAVIRAQLQSSVGSTSVRIVGTTTPDRFFLESVSPTTGSPNGGDIVRISGGGFLEPVRVQIGGALAEVLSVTPTLIRARTPATTLAAGATRTVDLTVINDVNGPSQASDSLTGVFTYTRGGTALQPIVFSVTPNVGPNEGGTRLTIEGDGFEAPVQVLMGSGSASGSFSGVEARVVSVSTTKIVIETPAARSFGQINLNDEVDLLVRNVNSGATAIFTNAFRFGVDVIITSIGPSQGPYIGGTLVTVFGQGFDEPVAVEMGGVGQQIVSVTGTEIIVRTVGIDPPSCGDVSGQTVVTNIETGDGNTGPTFIYRVEALTPRVTSISPSSGSPGTDATVFGANLINPFEIVFSSNGEQANAVIDRIVSEGEADITIPFLPEAAFDTAECDDDGDGTRGTRLIDTNVDLVITNLVTTCTSTFRGGFLLRPSDRSCRNDAGQAPAPPAAPSAAFSFQIVSGLTVQFVDDSTGDPTSWLWDFGDGATSTSQNPSHTYGAAGGYSVTLTVTNAGGNDSTVQVVTVP